MGNYIPTRNCDSPGSYEIITFYYYVEDNRFVNGDGESVYDIFRYISPNRLRIFKEQGEALYIRDERNGLVYEFLYPDYFSELVWHMEDAEKLYSGKEN